MNRLAWVAVSVALVLGLIAGLAYIGTRAQKMEAGSAAETCAPLDVEGISLLKTALRAYSDLSFRSGYAMGPLHGPFDDLRIVSVEVDGPGFEGAGDVGVWAIAPGVPPGWVGGAILYSLNPVARRVEGRSVFPGARLRQFIDDGESLYDPQVLRATAPVVAASCRTSSL